jgi:protein-disulfide isomerase
MNRLAPVSATEDHIDGPVDADIVLIEYGDFECPYCGEAYPELKAVKEAMGDALCFVFRHFPLRQAHPHAERAAEFAEAAATTGKFWQMHALLYENQQALTDAHLIAYAKRLGLDAKLIESALAGNFAARVQRDFVSGVRSGVNGTPCLFLNGERYDGPRDARSLIELMRG